MPDLLTDLPAEVSEALDLLATSYGVLPSARQPAVRIVRQHIDNLASGIEAMARDAAALHDRLAECEKDAGRWRFVLRLGGCPLTTEWATAETDAERNAAIDAAIQARGVGDG